MNIQHDPSSCPICGAVHKMNEDDIKQQKYLVELLRQAVNEWPYDEKYDGTTRVRYYRDPFRFSEDDVIDAHEQMPDRIPSEWMEAKW